MSSTPLRPAEGSSKEVFGTVSVDQITGAVTGASDAALTASLDDVVALLRLIRDECRATRLAVQERVNEGNPTQHDFLDLAQSMRDSAEEL